MHAVDDQSNFKNEYSEYVEHVLAPTRGEVRELLRWKEPAYWQELRVDRRLSVPSPVQRIHSRIKRPESVLDKIFRNPTKYDGVSAASIRKMHDTLGFRIVVYFTSQLPLVHRQVLEHPLLEVSEHEPPSAFLSEDMKRRLGLDLPGNVRETGYSSVHYVIRLRESVVPAAERPWFELQVRTLAEDAWAEIHHILGYKPDKRTSLAVRRQFQLISSMLTTIDEHFNFLSEELGRFQKEVEYDADSPLNAENLPSVLAEFELTCAQREIDGLLKVLNSRGLPLVGNFRRIATDERIQRIRTVYQTESGLDPSAFEVVAHLASLAGLGEGDGEDEIRLIRTQIAILRDWESHRHGR